MATPMLAGVRQSSKFYILAESLQKLPNTCLEPILAMFCANESRKQGRFRLSKIPMSAISSFAAPLTDRPTPVTLAEGSQLGADSR